MVKYKEAVMLDGTRITHGKPRRLEGMSEEIQLTITIWDAINQEEGFEEITVTALADGVHTAKNSKHYGIYRVNAGKVGWWIDAVDLRTRYLSSNQKMSCADILKKRLGKDFDVVVHDSHIHVEYDPK